MAEDAITSSEAMASDLEKLRADNTEFEETKSLLHEAVTHSEELSSRVEFMTAEIEESRKKLKDASRIAGQEAELVQVELSQAKSKVESISAELEVATKRLKEADEEKEKKVRFEGDELERVRGEMGDIKDKLAATEIRLSAAMTSLAQSKRDSASFEQNAASSLTDTKAQLTAVSSELSTTKAKLATSVASEQVANGQVDDYKSTLANMRMESNDMQKVEAELRAEVAKLKEELQVVPPPPPPPQAPPATEKLKVLARKNQELKDKVGQQQSQIQTLTASLSHIKRTIASTSTASNDDTVSPAPFKLQPPPAFSPAAKMISNGGGSGYPPLSSTSVQDIVNDAMSQLGDAKKAAAALSSLLKKCNEQKSTNASLLSKIQKVSNSIQVCCRIRPLGVDEMGRKERVVVEPLSETEVGYFCSKSKQWKSFAYDKVFGPDQSQQEVFEEVEPLCLSVVDGFNACIFAYGQTGSGKTFTMEGTAQDNQYGICVRTLHKIFEILNFRRESYVPQMDDEEGKEQLPPEFTYEIKIGMLEIYNEDVRDLLSSDLVSVELKRDSNGKIQVPHLTRTEVTSLSDVLAVMAQGNKNRAVAATNINEQR